MQKWQIQLGFGTSSFFLNNFLIKEQIFKRGYNCPGKQKKLNSFLMKEKTIL